MSGTAGSCNTTDAGHGGERDEQHRTGWEGAHATGTGTLTAAGATCTGATRKGTAETGAGAEVCRGAGGTNK